SRGLPRNEYACVVELDLDRVPRYRRADDAFGDRALVAAEAIVDDLDHSRLARFRAPGNDIDCAAAERDFAGLARPAVEDDSTDLHGHGRIPKRAKTVAGVPAR